MAYRYILQKVSEEVSRKCPLGPRFYNFQLPTPTLSPQYPHLLNHRRWCHLANKLKPYCEEANCQNFRVWNSHRQHAVRLFQTTPCDRLFLSNSSTLSDSEIFGAMIRTISLFIMYTFVIIDRSTQDTPRNAVRSSVTIHNVRICFFGRWLSGRRGASRGQQNPADISVTISGNVINAAATLFLLSVCLSPTTRRRPRRRPSCLLRDRLGRNVQGGLLRLINEQKSPIRGFGRNVQRAKTRGALRLKHGFVWWCKRTDVVRGVVAAPSMTDRCRVHCIQAINCHQRMTVASTSRAYIATLRSCIYKHHIAVLVMLVSASCLADSYSRDC